MRDALPIAHFPQVYENFKHFSWYRFWISITYYIYTVYTYVHGEMKIFAHSMLERSCFSIQFANFGRKLAYIILNHLCAYFENRTHAASFLIWEKDLLLGFTCGKCAIVIDTTLKISYIYCRCTFVFSTGGWFIEFMRKTARMHACGTFPRHEYEI